MIDMTGTSAISSDPSSSCDVADALTKLKVPHGGFLAGLTMWSPKRQDGPTKIVGPAYTVKYVRKNYENEPKPSGHYVRSVGHVLIWHLY